MSTPPPPTTATTTTTTHRVPRTGPRLAPPRPSPIPPLPNPQETPQALQHPTGSTKPAPPTPPTNVVTLPVIHGAPPAAAAAAPAAPVSTATDMTRRAVLRGSGTALAGRLYGLRLGDGGRLEIPGALKACRRGGVGAVRAAARTAASTAKHGAAETAAGAAVEPRRFMGMVQREIECRWSCGGGGGCVVGCRCCRGSGGGGGGVRRVGVPALGGVDHPRGGRVPCGGPSGK